MEETGRKTDQNKCENSEMLVNKNAFRKAKEFFDILVVCLVPQQLYDSPNQEKQMIHSYPKRMSASKYLAHQDTP